MGKRRRNRRVSTSTVIDGLVHHIRIMEHGQIIFLGQYWKTRQS